MEQWTSGRRAGIAIQRFLVRPWYHDRGIKVESAFRSSQRSLVVKLNCLLMVTLQPWDSWTWKGGHEDEVILFCEASRFRNVWHWFSLHQLSEINYLSKPKKIAFERSDFSCLVITFRSLQRYNVPFLLFSWIRIRKWQYNLEWLAAFQKSLQNNEECLLIMKVL